MITEARIKVAWKAQELEKPLIQPNKFQVEALEVLKNTTKDKGIIAMATGLGKTLLSALWFKEKIDLNPDAKLLFVCHNKDILTQAKEKEFKMILGEGIEFGFYDMYYKDIKQVTFATVQTLSKNLRLFNPGQFDYLVVDEAHHYGARTFKKVIKYFKPKFLLGLTATPNRMDGIPLFEVCGDVLYKATFFEGINQSLLSKINYVCVDNDIDFSKLKLDSNGRYKENDLNRLLCIKQYDEAIIKEYLNNKSHHNRKKTIVFCATVRHAHRLTKLFKKQGISATSLTNNSRDNKELQKIQRKTTLEDFKNGKYEIIFVRDLFNEGIDIPNADMLMMIRPTRSHIIFSQQLGRGLRKADGKDYLLVLDFTGNAHNCEVNYEVLGEIIGKDLISIARRQPSSTNELKIISIGCEVRLSKTQIDIFNNILDKESIIKEYWRIRNQLNHPVKQKEWKKFSKHTHKVIYARWGSYNKFLMALGEKLNKGDKIPKGAIIDNYKKLKEKLGRVPLAKEFVKEFGFSYLGTFNKNYENLLKANGDVHPLNCKKEKEFFVKNMAEWKEMYGKQPKYREFTEFCRCSDKALEKAIHWGDLLNLFGWTKQWNVSNEDLFRQYKTLRDKLKKPVTNMEWRKDCHGSPEKIYKSWKNFKLKMEDRLMITPASNPNITIIDKYKPINKIEKEISKKVKVSKAKVGRWKAGYKQTLEKEGFRTKIISSIEDGDTCLLLESPELSALKEIEKQGKKPKKIVIPNHIEFKTLRKALENFKTDLKIEVINTSVGQYLADTDEQFQWKWLDYCSGFNQYIGDLDCLFDRQRGGMKLFLTYNTFDMQKKDDNYYFTKVISHILDKGRKTRLLPEVCARYKWHIYNLGFDIRQKAEA